MVYKTNDEIELIRESSLLVCKTLAELSKHIREGQTGNQLDKIAEEFIRDHGATPGFKGYRGFPATLCISVNEQVVHGLPNDRPFESTDIISVDCGVVKNGFYGDVAYTFIGKDANSAVTQTLPGHQRVSLSGHCRSKRGQKGRGHWFCHSEPRRSETQVWSCTRVGRSWLG
jgi:methionyl aminopeptidase